MKTRIAVLLVAATAALGMGLLLRRRKKRTEIEET